MTPSRELAQIVNLIELAVHPGTPRHEARNAAMAACRRLYDSDVLSVGAAPPVKEHVVVLQGPWAVMADHEYSIRVAHLRKAEIGWIPKEHIRETEWEDPPRTKRAWPQGVLRKIVVSAEWLEGRGGML